MALELTQDPGTRNKTIHNPRPKIARPWEVGLPGPHRQRPRNLTRGAGHGLSLYARRAGMTVCGAVPVLAAVVVAAARIRPAGGLSGRFAVGGWGCGMGAGRRPVRSYRSFRRTDRVSSG